MNPSSQGRDWFIGAIEASGSVHQCLQTLCDELDFKKKFVQTLIALLHKNIDSKSDDLTLLHQQCRQLQQTLSVRISLLSPERETPWFRRSLTHTVGPFTGSIFQDPVFFSYDPKTTSSLEQELVESFKKSRIAPIDLWSLMAQKSFKDGEHCLWTRLLDYNHRLKAHGQITLAQSHISLHPGTPFSLNLEEINDETPLPFILESRPLRAFLLNIQTELRTIRSLVQECFDTLYHASTPFWAVQKKNQSKFQRGDSSSFHHNPKSSPPYPFQLLPRERESLTFMGFNTLPNLHDLRQKYRELAKKMHPDIHKGQDHAFKKLVESYRILQKKISKEI